MLHSVALVIVDIVKSRTIHNRLREEVGTKADSHYTKKIYAPFRQRVDALLAAHDGRLDNDTGDQIAAFFDHSQDAIQFALNLQKSMSAEPIAVPDGCGCPHLMLHAAVGTGTMDSAAYEHPGTVKVGAFNDLARILAVAADGQTLVTPEARASAGKIPDVSWHEWDVVLPKEQDRLKVLEIVPPGAEPQRPKDMAGVTQQAMALVSQNKLLADENAALKANLTAALERVQARADTGDPLALAAIDQARNTGDLTQLDAALDAEWERREKQLRDQFKDMLELSRESAAVAFMHGDIDKAIARTQTILRIAPDDLDATHMLGKIHELHGDLPAAERQFRREIELAAGDESARSRPLGRLGLIARTRGNMEEAEKLHREALEIDRKLVRLEGQAIQLNGLGAIALTRGNLDEAEKLYREALEINRKLGRLEGQSGQLNNLGLIAWTRGNLAEAEKLVRDALEISRTLGHLEWQANQLGNLGLIAQPRGDLDEAEKLYREALEINRKLGRLEGQASGLGNLGLIAKTRGNLDGAEKLLRESLEIDRKLGRLEGQAITLGNLGLIAQTCGNLDGAEKLYRQSLEINRKLGRLEGQAIQLGNLGLIAQTRRDLDEAERLYREALEINRKLGRLEGQAAALVNLSDVSRDKGDFAAASELAESALQLARQCGHGHFEAAALESLGTTAHRRGDPAEARRLLTQSRDAFTRIGMPPDAKRMQALLDGLPAEPPIG